MESETISERYVLLALRLGRLIDGLVDSYFGPPAWAAQVENEPPAAPAQLAAEAIELREQLSDAELEVQRERWLDAQLLALETTASRLAGKPIAWIDEVELCFGVRPAPPTTKRLQEIHADLDAVVPGSGGLAGRYRQWNELNHVPTEKVLPALRALRGELQASAREIVPLPAGEKVTYRLVEDEPWLAYNWYLGGFRSRVDICTDLPMTLWALPLLAAHEAYPGHHTERVAKDERLLQEKGWIENSVTVLNAPEALISEGIAMLALEQAFDDPHVAVSEILRPIGVGYEPDLMRVVYEAETAFDAVRTNAAALLHGEGRQREEVHDYICRWALSSPEVATHTLSFIEDPAFRAYVSSYADGARLCRGFVERNENGFRRLLTEQLTTADLVDAGPRDP